MGDHLKNIKSQLQDGIKKIEGFVRTPAGRLATFGLVWTAHQALRARGYDWEVQRHGDLKLGLWRKKFRKKTLRKPFVKRVVFVPGFGDTPLSWIGVFTLIEPVLRTKFDEVVLVDLPGYNGRLFAESLFPTIDAILDSVFDVLDSLKPHTVVGHSLGGFLTAHYAGACSTGRRPTGRVQNYSDLDSAIVIDPSGFHETDEALREWESKLERLISEGGEFWRPLIFAKEPFWFRFLSDHFLTFLARQEVAPFVRSAKSGSHELRDVLPQIRTKMTVIWGEEDKLLPSTLAEGWLKFLTCTREPARAVILRGSGHSPQIEATATIAAVLGQILAGRKPHKLGRRWYQLIEPRPATRAASQAG